MGKYLPLCDAYIGGIKARITEMSVDEVESNQRVSDLAYLLDVCDVDGFVKTQSYLI